MRKMKQVIIVLSFIIISTNIQAQAKTNTEPATTVVQKNSEEKFKITHGPYLQHLDETSVSIVWVTNRKGISWVELAPDDSTHFYAIERPKYFSSSHGLKNISTVNVVHIKHLQPGMRYRYRIYSQEVLSRKGITVRYGEVAATRVYQHRPLEFRTNNALKEDISFLVLNDIHERNEVMKTLLKGTDWKNTDLVFFNGDMVNSSRSEDQLFASFMDTAVQLFASEIPMYYARGNHETRDVFAGSFDSYFPGPDGKLYYMFRQGPVCFIVLDSGEDKPDSDIEYSGITDFDHYRDEQALWLGEAIKRKDFLDAPFKIAIAHIPPFGGWHGEQQIADKFVPLLNEAGIDVMLCAHLHRNVHSKADATHHFPIIVNSNNSILKVNANSKQLQINLVDIKGAVMDKLTIDKQ